MPTFVVAYDTPSDARRRRFVRALQRFGVRVQFSVFELRCSDRELERLRAALERIADDAEDRLVAYPTPAGVRWSLGEVRSAETPGAIVA